MARKPVTFISAHDLTFPTGEAPFSPLVARELGDGFTLTDGFDAILAALAADVAADQKALAGLDDLLVLLDLSHGPIDDGTLAGIITDLAALQASGDVVSGGVLGAIADLLT